MPAGRPTEKESGKSLAERLMNMTRPGLDEHQRRIKGYDRAYEIYRGSGRSPEGTEPWQSKLRIPYGMYNLDTALVNIVSDMPKVKVLPRHPDVADNAKAFQVVMDYFINRSRLVQKQPTIVQQGLIFGITGAKSHYAYSEKMRTQRNFEPNPFGEPIPVVTNTLSVNEGPEIEPWDVYDMWWDPFARDVQGAAYVVLRSYQSKDDLLRQSGIYSNLDALFATGDASDRNQSAQERRVNAERQMTGRFELQEIWTRDRVQVIGNKQVVLRDEPNPHWHGQKPIVVTSTRPDLFRMAGIPETELVEHLQEALWTVQNARMDNLKMSVMRGLTYREGGVADPNVLQLRPRFRWPVVDHGDVQFQAPPPLPPEAYREEEGLIQRMQLVTGISQYVSGADVAGLSSRTATGIAFLQRAAAQLIRFKADMIQNNLWQPVFEMWGADIQQYMTEPLYARIVGPGEDVQFVHVTPDQVAGEFDFVLVGTTESSERQEARSNAVGLLNAFAPLAQLGIVNWKAVLEMVASAYDFPNPDALFNAPPPQQAMNGTGLAPLPSPIPQAPALTGGQPLPDAVAQAVLKGRL